MPRTANVAAGIAVMLILGVAACAPDPPRRAAPDSAQRAASDPTHSAAPPSAPTFTPPQPEPTPGAAPPGSEPAADSEPRMLRARMQMPAIGLGTVPVVPYRGSPDDRPGTRIQDGGVSASPFGRQGGVGPGQVGNYLVTAHRTTATAPFADLPLLRRGEHVLITAGGRVFDYRIVETRSTSFRSQQSLARQSAAVPGHPKQRATRPMITLSTCATPEDHARGNYWADEFGNPEHRIDKIGVLVDVRPAPAA